MDVAQRVERLNPARLREQAEKMLAETDDPVALVAQLLRNIRQQDDHEEAVRVGYQHSIDWERDLHEMLINQEHVEIARAIEREARHPRPQGRQELTYEGGLRKAARIARGWR